MLLGTTIIGNRPIVKFDKRTIKLIIFIQFVFTCCTIIFYHVKKPIGSKPIFLCENVSTETRNYNYAKDQPFVTIVTAFYHFSKSKHSIDEYMSWLPNLFITVAQPMVIFTDAKLALALKSFRRADAPTIILTNYSTPWEIPAIQNLKHIFKSQMRLDPEDFHHSSDLYAIWAAKPWFLNFTSFWNPFKTKYFMWIDAGAFRHPSYRFHQWPHPTRLLRSFECDSDGSEKLLLGLIHHLPTKICKHIANMYNIKNGPILGDFIQGTMFAGSHRLIRWWAETYFQTLDLFIEHGYFIGKDQSIMNAIAFSQPSQIRVMALFKVNCGDPWFAFGPIWADPYDNTTSMHKCLPKNFHTILFPLDKVCIDTSNTVS